MRAALIALILLSLTATAYADDTEAIALEAAFLAVHTIDYLQTRDIFATGRREANPILRGHEGRVLPYFAGTAIAHAAISYALKELWPEERYCERWQYFTLGVQGTTTLRNWSVGVGLRF